LAAASPNWESSFNGFTLGPDGDMWGTDYTNQIARITPSGSFSEFSIPTQGGSPFAITTGGDGNLWFGEQIGFTNNLIEKMTPAGVFTAYPLPFSVDLAEGIMYGTPNAITAGPDGNLWFATNDGKVGRITPAGTVTGFPVPGATDLAGITVGPGGTLWFSGETATHAIVGYMTVVGAATIFPVPSGSFGGEITLGPDGNLWFTADGTGSEICKVTPSGIVSEFPVPGAALDRAISIAPGSDGNLWFVERNSQVVGTITPSGVVDELSLPIPPRWSIFPGPGQTLWLTGFPNSYGYNVIDQLSPDNVSLSAHPGVAFTGTVASFIDPDTLLDASHFTATIGWGDGSTSTGTVAGEGGEFTVSGTHSYAEEGPFTVSVNLLETAPGTAGVTVTAPVTVVGPVSRFVVSGVPTPSTAGAAGSITVTAEDAYGNTVTGYTGTIHFTSSDPQAALPADYTFTAADAGVHTFVLTLKTAGAQSLTATASGGITGTQADITVNPAAAASLVVAGFPSPVASGMAGMVTVTVRDAFGNLASGYRGTIHFTSSDPQAVLPAEYTFTGADGGVHTFRLTLKTAGVQSVAAADTVNPSLTASQTRITVNRLLVLDTVGIFDPATATWYLRNSNSSGPPNLGPFGYGAAGWIPVVGDWNGDSKATIGVVDPATMTWYLRNENSAGSPDVATPFPYGAPGWIPVVGDWNGSGHTGIGVFDPSTGTWYLRNEDSPGLPDAGVF
jgi:streptogramin lyase